MSHWLATWTIDNIVLSLLVLSRMTALMLAIPSLSVTIPRRVQVMLAFCITILIVPTVSHHATSLPTLPDPTVIVAVGREVLLGMLMGITVQLIITGLQIGAEVTSTAGALQASQLDEQTGESTPILAKFVGLMTIAILFAGGGHRIVLSVLLDSFRSLPPGSVVMDDTMMDQLIFQITSAMAAGIRFAAPVITALILTNLATAFVSRTMPQLNVFAIGLSINALALMVVTAVTIGSAGLIFQDELTRAAIRLSQLW